MLTTDQVGRFKTRIERELSGLLEWVESPEIRGMAKQEILRRQRRLETAFLRIQHGVYGVCCDCGAILPSIELEADPSTPVCIYCEQERETVTGR